MQSPSSISVTIESVDGNQLWVSINMPSRLAAKDLVWVLSFLGCWLGESNAPFGGAAQVFEHMSRCIKMSLRWILQMTC